jgi:hypothetical protein
MIMLSISHNSYAICAHIVHLNSHSQMISQIDTRTHPLFLLSESLTSSILKMFRVKTKGYFCHCVLVFNFRVSSIPDLCCIRSIVSLTFELVPTKLEPNSSPCHPTYYDAYASPDNNIQIIISYVALPIRKLIVHQSLVKIS